MVNSLNSMRPYGVSNQLKTTIPKDISNDKVPKTPIGSELDPPGIQYPPISEDNTSRPEPDIIGIGITNPIDKPPEETPTPINDPNGGIGVRPPDVLPGKTIASSEQTYYKNIGLLSRPDAKHPSWNNKATINGMTGAKQWAQDQLNPFDTNKDKALNKQEAFNSSLADLSEPTVFKVADLNKDNKVDAKEYLALTMWEDSLGNKDGIISDSERAAATDKIKKGSTSAYQFNKTQESLNKYKNLINQVKL